VRSTGIVRRLDHLGRVVLPIELRRTLGIAEGAALEIFIHGETVMLRLYQPLCVFCHHGGTLVTHQGKQVCQACRAQLSLPEPSVQGGQPS
jgi:transcriptional pleiotropic regulator of transition state genes